MQSMRAPSLALAYCLTARAVPGPHRPSRPKWELGLQVFDYFEEPGPPPAQPPPPLAPKSTVTPCRPKICRKAEFTSCCRHLFPGSGSQLQTEISSADRRSGVHTDTARLHENAGGGDGAGQRGVKRKHNLRVVTTFLTSGAT